GRVRADRAPDSPDQGWQPALPVPCLMSETYVLAALRRLVDARAKRCCEYCLLPHELLRLVTAPRNVILEVALPRAAAADDRLHEGALGLHRVHEVMGGPLVDQLAQRDDPQLAVARLSRQVGRRDCGVGLQVGAPQT